MANITSLKKQLFHLIRHFLRDLGASRASRSVSMDAVLIDDLGLGSLERVELLRVLEQHFAVHLSVEAMMQIDTVRDLYHLLELARPSVDGDVDFPEIEFQGSNLHVDPSGCESLIEVLQEYCATDPQRIHACILQPGGKVLKITYGDLWRRVLKTAQVIQQKKLEPQSVIALALSNPDSFMVSYLAIILSGHQPLVMRMPVNIHNLRPLYWRVRLPMLMANDVVALFIQNSEMQQGLVSLQQSLSSDIVNFIYDDVIAYADNGSATEQFSPIDADQIMYRRLYWHTDQKSHLKLTHRQWLERVREDGSALQIKPSDVVFSWLSLFEPVGLLSAWLGSLYYGLPFIWMSPQSFFSAPESWLWAIHQYRASISFSPNSGYAYCLQKVKAAKCTGLDLSCWHTALNAGEIIHAETVQKFCDFFAAYGFSAKSMQQGYIPAGEAMLYTLSNHARLPHIEHISRKLFFNSRRAQILSPDKTGGLSYIAYGKVLPSAEIRIVNEDKQVLASRRIGTIEYRARQEGVKWRTSGDLGYMADETLYVVASNPQRIVKGGIYIADYAMRMVVEGIPALEKSNWLSFCVADKSNKQNIWVALIFTKKRRNIFYMRRMQSILGNRLAQCFGTVPDHIVFLPESMSKKLGNTKQDKIQAAQAAYYAGDLLPRKSWYHHHNWWGKVKAFFGVIGRGLAKFLIVLYSIYFLLMLLILFLPTWVIVMSLPVLLGKKIFKLFTKMLFIFGLCPVLVKDKKILMQPGPVIFTPNHTSYLDVMALISVLPSAVCFVGKRELKSIPLLGSIFKKMGHLFVDPADFSRGEENLSQIKDAIKNGSSIVVYPEGTFTHVNGLRPFKLGAFAAAVQTGTPVCPVICKGLRNVFRDREVLLRPGIVRVIAKPWLFAKGDDMSAVLNLRDLTLESIAADCDEPVLELVAAGPPED